MSRSERYLPRHVRTAPGAGRAAARTRSSDATREGVTRGAPRHASPLTAYRRWRHRRWRYRYGGSTSGRRPRHLGRRLTRFAGWALLVIASVLVYLLLWQLLGQTVSADSRSAPGPAPAPVHRDL